MTDCGDAQDATTTLRGVVASASDNDVIDVSQCSAIVLLHGVISTLLNLTIQGPLDGTTSIDAGANDRAFVDTGYNDTVYSVLTLNHLLIEHGRAPEADPNGGCVYAYSLDVQNSTLNDCAATSNSLDARGGAVFAAILTLTSSAVTNSSVTSSSGLAGGGAVFAGLLTLTSSVVTSSSATSASRRRDPPTAALS